jgi:hypothetical protein
MHQDNSNLFMPVQEKEEDKEEDYVYDVYYRDDADLEEQGVTNMNIGSLVWFDEQSEYLDDDSDSELGDNVDEDSNGNIKPCFDGLILT